MFFLFCFVIVVVVVVTLPLQNMLIFTNFPTFAKNNELTLYEIHVEL